MAISVSALSEEAAGVIAEYTDEQGAPLKKIDVSKVQSLVEFYGNSPKWFRNLNFILCGIPRLIYRIRINAILTKHIKHINKAYVEIKRLDDIRDMAKSNEKLNEELVNSLENAHFVYEGIVDLLKVYKDEKTVSTKVRTKLNILVTTHNNLSKK